MFIAIDGIDVSGGIATITDIVNDIMVRFGRLGLLACPENRPLYDIKRLLLSSYIKPAWTNELLKGVSSEDGAATSGA